MQKRLLISIVIFLIISASIETKTSFTLDDEKSISFSSANWNSIEISNNSYSSINGPSLVLDSNHFSHVVFIDSQSLYHTTNLSGQWVTTLIDNDAQYTPSVAIDQNDVLHIAYHIDSSSCGCLGYATNTGGSWNSQIIDSYNGMFFDATWTDIEVDSFGNIIIAYYDDDGLIGMANGVSGSWNYYTLDLTPGPFEDYSPDMSRAGNLILDSNDAPHIVWFDESNNMHYSTNKTGTWSDHLFPDYAPTTGDIAVDSNDNIHIVFSKHDWDEDNLSYYNNIGGTWTNYSIDNTISINPNSNWVKSLAIDQNDNIHIAVVESEDNSLIYLTNSLGAWNSNIVTNLVDVGINQPSLKLDSNDNPYIAYSDYTNSTVLLSFVGENSGEILDDDNDGVPNDSDQCPNTPSGSSVDANGCAFGESDSDLDGVSDLLDNCPNTPLGESVDIYGCSQSQLDDDNDGVMNDSDLCPNTPAGEYVDATGCSQSQLDDDNDGVMNDSDLCPNTPVGESVDATGCSQSQLDDDNDGVMNDSDLCPNTPAGESVDATGCSQSQLDDDNDGVVNSIDQCPNTPAGVNVNYQGCNNPPSCNVSYENSTGFLVNQAEELAMLNGNTSVNIELVSDTYIFNILCTDPEGDQITMLVSIDGGSPISFSDSPVNSGPITVPVQDGMTLSKTLSFDWSDDMNSGSYSMDITLAGNDSSSSWIPGFDAWVAIFALAFSLFYRKRYC
tara:strand:- start:2903 stop:5077 length:2175 start_codon:yes stop_codon:yes gene_type:complete